MSSIPKPVLRVTLAALLFISSTGCGNAFLWRTPVKPPVGVLFTQYSAPMTTEPGGVPATGKVGTASTFYVRDPLITGFDVAWEDASIEAAAEEGGISQVYYADYEVLQVLGVFGEFRTRVYGE